MGGKYELRCFEPIHYTAHTDSSIEYFNSWFQMRKAYRKKTTECYSCEWNPDAVWTYERKGKG